MNHIDYEKPTLRFDLSNFSQVLENIAARAKVSEHDSKGLVKEIQWLRESGLLKIVLPGETLDFKTPNMHGLLTLLKAIGKANLSVGRIYEGHINTLYLIHLYADEEQRENWYDGVLKQDHLFGVWNTQAQNGIQFAVGSNGFIIEGSKTFCSGAGLVDRALITGNIDSGARKGWQMTIVDMSKIANERIDKESWKPLGMKASASYTVDFSGYVSTEADFISTPGIYLTQPFFSGGAIRFAAVQLGGAETIAEHTIDYLKALRRTEDPIQRLRISTMMTQLVSGRIWLAEAAKNYDRWSDTEGFEDDLIAFANMTRTMIEDICLRIMDESNKCVGARGLLPPYELERIFRDLTFYLRQPAPDATRLNVADFFIKNQNPIHDFSI